MSRWPLPSTSVPAASAPARLSALTLGASASEPRRLRNTNGRPRRDSSSGSESPTRVVIRIAPSTERSSRRSITDTSSRSASRDMRYPRPASSSWIGAISWW